MMRLLVVSVASLLAMLCIPACSATPPEQAMMAEDGPPIHPHVPRVLVFPFAPTGSVGAYDWMGRGIQQSLLADLSRSGSAQVVFPATQPAQGRVNPLEIGAEAGANVVVMGTYQVNQGQVRVTGEVFDVGSARNLGGIKTTGPVSDLFKLEDDLDDQLARVLPSSYAAAATSAGRVTPPAAAVDSGPTAPPTQTAATWSPTSQPSMATSIVPPAAAPVAPSSTVIPETTYNYYDATPAVTSPPAGYAYEDPYYDSDDAYPYNGAYYGGWPFYGYVGVGVYGPGFYGGYGYRGYGYRGYGNRGPEHPFNGGSRGGFGGGGFHGGFGGRGGGGGGFGGGHR